MDENNEGTTASRIKNLIPNQKPACTFVAASIPSFIVAISVTRLFFSRALSVTVMHRALTQCPSASTGSILKITCSVRNKFQKKPERKNMQISTFLLHSYRQQLAHPLVQALVSYVVLTELIYGAWAKLTAVSVLVDVLLMVTPMHSLKIQTDIPSLLDRFDNQAKKLPLLRCTFCDLP